jgi:hypothetical protein
VRKTRDLFKKVGRTKGTFHAKMGAIKDRNGKDLTEAEEMKKRWQKGWGLLISCYPNNIFKMFSFSSWFVSEIQKYN